MLVAVEARKLEHDRPPTLNQRKKDNQHKSSYTYVSTFLESTVDTHWDLMLP